MRPAERQAIDTTWKDGSVDGQRFDALARAFAGQSTRRRFLWRGAALTGAVGSLARIGSADAARRGTSGNTSICSPDGSGGYYRISVPSVLLGMYLNNGSIISDCCGDYECEASNSVCSASYCDLGAGACAVAFTNGVACERPGCADGYCSDGVCADPPPMSCAGDGYCNSCVYDACNHHCDCYVKPCYSDDWQCQDTYCDPAQQACIGEPINEGLPCNTFGFDGVCTLGYCTAPE